MANSSFDPLTEFTKTKMHFALALLGTLFALHPFVERLGEAGFTYLGVRLSVFDAYAVVAALLALTVYFYAVALLSERAYSWMERTGNYAYAMAIMALPLYGGLYLSSVLAERVGQAHLAVAPLGVALGFGVLWAVLSASVAWRLRKRLGDQDRTAKLQQLEMQELQSLNRAQELFAGAHYDLSVVEAWKAIEARLQRALLARRVRARAEGTEAMIRTAARARILSAANLKALEGLRAQWNVAVSTDPLTREAAETALATTRNILSTIPLEQSASRALPVV